MKKPDKSIYIPPHLRTQSTRQKESSDNHNESQMDQRANSSDICTPAQSDTGDCCDENSDLVKNKEDAVNVPNDLDEIWPHDRCVGTKKYSHSSHVWSSFTNKSPIHSDSIFSIEKCIKQADPDKIDQKKPKRNYLDELGNVLEVSGYSTLLKSEKISEILRVTGESNIKIILLDNKHSLAVFQCKENAEAAKRVSFKEFRLSGLAESDAISRTYARENCDELLNEQAVNSDNTSSMVVQNIVLRTLGKEVPRATTEKLNTALSQMKIEKANKNLFRNNQNQAEF